MNTPGKYSDKAQEIAYALIRLAAYMRRKEFRARVEGLAFALVESVAGSDLEAALYGIATIQNVVQLCASIYEIETVNARVLLQELIMLDSAIRKSLGVDVLPNIKTMFSNSANTIAELPNMYNADAATDNDSNIDLPDGLKETSIDVADDLVPQPSEHFEIAEKVIERVQLGMVSVGSAIRQSAILNKIKTFCNNGVGDIHGFKGCRMKDLIAEFPDVSERTLRYDLQRLLQHGSVQRVGNGGPASYYMIK